MTRIVFALEINESVFYPYEGMKYEEERACPVIERQVEETATMKFREERRK